MRHILRWIVTRYVRVLPVEKIGENTLYFELSLFGISVARLVFDRKKNIVFLEKYV